MVVSGNLRNYVAGSYARCLLNDREVVIDIRQQLLRLSDTIDLRYYDYHANIIAAKA